jgi:hypothetical protein
LGERQVGKSTKKKLPKIQTARNFEKDLNEFLLSRKRENQTETLGGGITYVCRLLQGRNSK